MRLVVFWIFISFNLSVYAKNQIVTICHVVETAYANIIPYNSQYKQDKSTNFVSEKRKTGETYSLILEENNFNIKYKSQKHPMFNWSMNEELKNKNVTRDILNKDPKNLVLRMYYPGVQEQIYYFNLDNNANGYLVISNTRWNSALDCYNNQSIYFCKCKGAIK